MSKKSQCLMVAGIGIVVVACGAFTFSDGGLPATDLQNSDIARERMKRLWTGVYLYINEHEEGPPDPVALFPRYVPDPLTFWHPGDSDPPPTTIDNSVPNAPNSARISFEWGLLTDSGPADRFVLWDNLADNNGGKFINRFSASGLVETDPPFATPTPTKVAVALSRLRGIATAMRFYTNDNSEYLPNNFIRLWETGVYERTTAFWNPGTPYPPPSTFTNSEPDRPDSIQGSFLYYGMGFRIWELTPNQILVRDANRRNNDRVGFNVVWGDFRVTFEPDGLRGDGNRDGQVDTADWSDMHRCLGGPQSLIIAIPCRFFDWDSDDHVDLSDIASFMIAGSN